MDLVSSSKCIIFYWNRNRLLFGNRLEVLVEVHTRGPIEVIEFIGRQHAFLTDIIDQLNVCYGFQVWVYCLDYNILLFKWNYSKNSFSIKLLVNVGAAFALAVQTIYGYCNVKMVSVPTLCVQSVWLTLHMTIILMIIYYSCLLTSEVKNYNRINNRSEVIHWIFQAWLFTYREREQLALCTIYGTAFTIRT